MKHLIPILVLLLASQYSSAQNTYLKITKSNAKNDYVMYPPGTTFELKNKHGYIVFKNSDEPGTIKINEDYTLYVYPKWKSDPDVFNLKEGEVEKVLTSSHFETHNEDELIKSNGVTAVYSVIDSNTLEGKKNLEFRLSNGITFEYNDGKYRAYLNTEDNYIHIDDKYLIASDLGTLKLSFNPKNGQVWWVFEPNL